MAYKVPITKLFKLAKKAKVSEEDLDKIDIDGGDLDAQRTKLYRLMEAQGLGSIPTTSILSPSQINLVLDAQASRAGGGSSKRRRKTNRKRPKRSKRNTKSQKKRSKILKRTNKRKRK